MYLSPNTANVAHVTYRVPRAVESQEKMIQYSWHQLFAHTNLQVQSANLQGAPQFAPVILMFLFNSRGRYFSSHVLTSQESKGWPFTMEHLWL